MPAGYPVGGSSGFPMDWLNTIQVTVTLTSGRSESLPISRSSKVGTWRLKHRNPLYFSRLVTADARILSDPVQTLKAAGRASRWWPAHRKTETSVNWRRLCSQVLWGRWSCYTGFRGDSSVVQDQRGVQQVRGTEAAFSAILQDGSVVTWGEPFHGGDSSAVQDQLRSVQQIQVTGSAFAAILEDGLVVAWGNEGEGGNSSSVQHQLRNVQQIQVTGSAFAAILEDGLVVAWGNEGEGGNSSSVQHQLRNVQQFQATPKAFAAILEDGPVVTWGTPQFGGDALQSKIGWGAFNIFRPLRGYVHKYLTLCLYPIPLAREEHCWQRALGWGANGWERGERRKGCWKKSWKCLELLKGQWKESHAHYNVVLRHGFLVSYSFLSWRVRWEPAPNKLKDDEEKKTTVQILLRSWKLALLLHGAIQNPVVTAPLSEMSWAKCGTFMPPVVHSPPSRDMARLLHGGIQNMVVTALHYKMRWQGCRSAAEGSAWTSSSSSWLTGSLMLKCWNSMKWLDICCAEAEKSESAGWGNPTVSQSS